MIGLDNKKRLHAACIKDSAKIKAFNSKLSNGDFTGTGLFHFILAHDMTNSVTGFIKNSLKFKTYSCIFAAAVSGVSVTYARMSPYAMMVSGMTYI